LNETIRQYRISDRASMIKCMEGLQDYLISIDEMRRERRMPGYGESYTERLLMRIRREDGIAYVAEDQGRIIGLIAGVILRQSKEDLLECVPSKDGRILELFVDPQHRGREVGRMLMEKIERYFVEKKCDAVHVEVFAPNLDARAFYRRVGYGDRVVDMMKKP